MATDLKLDDFTNNLFTLLSETFESPSDSSSFYLDQQAGFLSTLNHVSAEQASKSITPRGTSVAAQVEHTRFYLEALMQFMDGRTERIDWRKSWRPSDVTPEAWDELKREMKASYERLMRKLRETERWGDDEVCDSLSILVHSAYHLGAIRQILVAL